MWQGYLPAKRRMVHSKIRRQVQKAHEKCFKMISEARNWQANPQYQNRHGSIVDPANITGDTCFGYWIQNIVGDLAPNTLRNYRERYRFNIQPVIDGLQLTDAKPMHCKIDLNQMGKDYAGVTIRQTYICMGTMLKSARINDLIPKHPTDSVCYTKPVRAKDDIKFLTRDEQRIFLEQSKRSHNYNQYALIPKTGLRTGKE